MRKVAPLRADDDLRIVARESCAKPGRIQFEHAIHQRLRRGASAPALCADGTDRRVDAEELPGGEHVCATSAQREPGLQLGQVRTGVLQLLA